MPVVMDREPACALDAVAHTPPRQSHDGDAGCIEIAFVNNMPDKALEATERQFLTLLEVAAENVQLRVTFYSLPDVPRTERGHHHLRARYQPIADLWNSRPDALIVTGTEPRAADLSKEPYWRTLAGLIDWAQDNVISSVWSCLAAHAAVRHLDGIDRHNLPDKCFGVFDCIKVIDHALTREIGFPLGIPHSRWNELRGDDLQSCGYTIVTRSPQVGVDTFVKRRKSCSFSSRDIPNTTRRRCGASIAATSVAFSRASATAIRRCPRRRSTGTPPSCWRPSPNAPWRIAARPCSRLSPIRFRQIRRKAGRCPPSASTAIGSRWWRARRRGWRVGFLPHAGSRPTPRAG